MRTHPRICGLEDSDPRDKPIPWKRHVIAAGDYSDNEQFRVDRFILSLELDLRSFDLFVIEGSPSPVFTTAVADNASNTRPSPNYYPDIMPVAVE